MIALTKTFEKLIVMKLIMVVCIWGVKRIIRIIFEKGDWIRHEINACRRVMKEEANKTREHVVCSNGRLLGHVKGFLITNLATPPWQLTWTSRSSIFHFLPFRQPYAPSTTFVPSLQFHGSPLSLNSISLYLTIYQNLSLNQLLPVRSISQACFIGENKHQSDLSPIT